MFSPKFLKPDIRIRFMLIAILSCALVPACDRISKPSGFQLRVASISQDQVDGSFISEDASLMFKVTQNVGASEIIDDFTFLIDVDRQLSLSDQDGNELIEIDAGDGKAVLSVMNGEYRLVYQQENAGIIRLPRDFSDQEFTDVNFIEEGDLELPGRLVDNPSYRLIPLLSRTLGELGITGQSTPVSFLLHKIASDVQQELIRKQIVEPTLPSGTITLFAEFAPDNFVIHIDDPDEGVVFKDNGRDGTRLYWKGLYKALGMSDLEAELTVSQCDEFLVENPTPEEEQRYQDCVAPPLPEEECVEADPEDDCFGRCGLGCGTEDDPCWESVCGDCCVHPGCQFHDWTCDEITLYLGCALPISLLAAPLLCGTP